MLKLNENEKIDSWDVVVRTTEGRELSCTANLGLDFSELATDLIDECLEEFYPCRWVEEE